MDFHIALFLKAKTKAEGLAQMTLKAGARDVW